MSSGCLCSFAKLHLLKRRVLVREAPFARMKLRARAPSTCASGALCVSASTLCSSAHHLHEWNFTCTRLPIAHTAQSWGLGDPCFRALSWDLFWGTGIASAFSCPEDLGSAADQFHPQVDHLRFLFSVLGNVLLAEIQSFGLSNAAVLAA